MVFIEKCPTNLPSGSKILNSTWGVFFSDDLFPLEKCIFVKKKTTTSIPAFDPRLHGGKSLLLMSIFPENNNELLQTTSIGVKQESSSSKPSSANFFKFDLIDVNNVDVSSSSTTVSPTTSLIYTVPRPVIKPMPLPFPMQSATTSTTSVSSSTAKFDKPLIIPLPMSIPMNVGTTSATTIQSSTAKFDTMTSTTTSSLRDTTDLRTMLRPFPFPMQISSEQSTASSATVRTTQTLSKNSAQSSTSLYETLLSTKSILFPARSVLNSSTKVLDNNLKRQTTTRKRRRLNRKRKISMIRRNRRRQNAQMAIQ